ncbi:MAG: hypothetical protein Q9166_001206 [cf. Caloplaca sp. 2 TL-2023]
MGNPEFAHITWKEESGEVVIKVVKEHNPAVSASSRGTPLYLIIRREMWFLADPPHDDSGPGGTFLSRDDANAAAHRIFQEKKGDAQVLKIGNKGDGCLECRAGHRDPSRGGYMFEADVTRIGWSEEGL